MNTLNNNKNIYINSHINTICPKCDNYTIKANISIDSYPSKKAALASLSRISAKEFGLKNIMSWEEKDLTLDELGKLLSSGHTYSNLFKKKGNILRPSDKRNDNFIGSQIITIDVDDTNFTLPEFCRRLSFEPSLVITSYSNLKEKNGKICERFHLLYCFDRVLNKEEFQGISGFLVNTIENDTNEKVDNCSKNLSQYYNGDNSNNYGNNNIIYNVDNIINNTNYIYYINSHINTICPKCDNPSKKEIVIEKYSRAWNLLNTIRNCGYSEVTHYYSYLGYFYRNESCEEGLKETSDNYLNILHSKNKQDGTKRRKFIYTNMLLRRYMKPNITIEELIYNSYMDVNYSKLVDNSDNVFDADYYERNAKNALSLEIDELEDYLKPVIEKIRSEKPKYMIGKKTSIGEIHKLVRKEEKKKIIENYNNGEFDKINVSERTLRRLGFSKNKDKEEKVKSLIDLNLSVLGNQKLLKEKGINISRTKLSNIIKSIKDNNININSNNSNINNTLSSSLSISIFQKCDNSDNTKSDSEIFVPEFGFDFWFNRDSEPEVVDNKEEEDIVIDSNIEYNFSGFSLSNL